MTGREKVLDAERQVRAMLAGEQDPTFCCPFCSVVTNEFNGMLCCNEAAEVVTAVLDHVEHIERCEVVEKTMDRLSKVMNSPLVMN